MKSMRMHLNPTSEDTEPTKKLPALKAVFFDMDGVLYNSMPGHEVSWVRAFAEEGLDFAPCEAYLNEGRVGRDTINIVFRRNYQRDATDEEVERIYGRKTAIFRRLPPAQPMPAMKSLVSRLRRTGVACFVVTGSGQANLLEKLEADYGFSRPFIVSGFDVTHGKPSPEPYLTAWRRTDFEKEACLVVENAPLGVRSAKAAGLRCAAVNTGKLDDEDLLAEGADELYAGTAPLCLSIIARIEG